jgi:hypothetical protein
MNQTDVSGKSLVQRLVDYRNRAEQLRILAEEMNGGPAVLIQSVAATYDSSARTIHAILSQSADLAS